VVSTCVCGWQPSPLPAPTQRHRIVCTWHAIILYM